MAKTDGLIVRVPRAAEILGVSRRTVTRWAATGELPPLDKGDGRQGSYTFETGVVRRKAEEREQKGIKPRQLRQPRQPRRVPVPGPRGSTT